MSENNGAGVIISKVARLHEHIEKLLKQIDVGSLPGIVIEGPSSIGALPKKICGLYFLSHHDKGLFYIGKTRDLKTRFGYHEHLEAAIAFGGITLAWLELPGEIATFCEEFFIADRLPGWNKRIPLSSLQHRNKRLMEIMRDVWRGPYSEEELDEMEQPDEKGFVVCRHCQREFMGRGLKKHQRSCASNRP